MALVLLGVWYAADLLLLVFAGVLVLILLRGFSRLFARTTGVGHGLSLALVVIIGLYLASQPGLYAGGLKRLLPWRARDRAGEVLGVFNEVL